MFTITEIPAAERQSWSKCKFYVIEQGRDNHMTFVTRGQAAKYIAQREKVAAQEAAKAAKTEADRQARLAHPVGAAVEAMRADTLVRVGQEFDRYIAGMAQKIENAKGDIDVLAPTPNSRTDSRVEYARKRDRRAAFSAICRTIPSAGLIVAIDDEKVARQREIELANASAQYDGFVAKLISKVGDCDSAEIEGSHVWGYSHLRVWKGDNLEVWKTQQILNVSVLGNLFNQWPTRRIR